MPRMVTTMPTGRERQGRVVSLSEASQSQPPPVPPEVAASPLFGVAMLRIAMELKKADDRPLDELISGVLSRMKLDEAEFRSYLERNGGLLRTIAQKRKY